MLTRRPRAKLPSVTLVLAALVVASAGFIGGVLVGKHHGSSGAGGPAAAFSRFAAARAMRRASAGSRRGGSGAGARRGHRRPACAFGGGNATIGTIKLVDGKTVYVQTTAGDIVQVPRRPGRR